MFPQALQTWWLQQFAQRQGAYLGLNSDGLLLFSGGNLASYGLDTLEHTLSIPAQFNLLLGMFPWDEPITMPFTEVLETWAEVHLWKTDGVYWVVLLEVTQATRLQQAWHQALNSSLLQEEMK